MSLMNEMLRDLDRRGGSQPEGAGRESHRAQPGRSRSYYGLLLGFVVLVVVASIVVWQVTGLGDSPTVNYSQGKEPPAEPDLVADAERTEPRADQQGFDEPEIVAALDEPVNKAPPTSRATPNQSSENEVPAPEQLSLEPLSSGLPSSGSIAPTDDQQIQTLLEQAREARDRDRLTRPAGDNAYEYYQQVLAVSADHPEALAGLASIAQRYRELAEAAMDRDSLDAAQRFLRRARSVEPQLSGIQSSEKRLQALRTQSGSENRTASVEPVAEDSGSSTLSVRLDPETEDRRRVEQARQWWSRGQQSRARHFLEQTLAQWPDDAGVPVLSTIALVEFYLEAGEEVQAEQLLSSAQGLPADEQARLSAELWVRRGDNVQALTTLENAAEEAVDNEPFRALWARLNYAEGRHVQATEHYQQLLSDFGEQPAYWLGLGLAEDAQQRDSRALQAFEQALASGAYDGNASIRRYLEGRVSALARQTQNREP